MTEQTQEIKEETNFENKDIPEDDVSEKQESNESESEQEMEEVENIDNEEDEDDVEDDENDKEKSEEEKLKESFIFDGMDFSSINYKDFEKIDQDQIDLYYILNDNKNNIEFLDEDLVAISKKEEEIKALKAKEKEEFDFQMEELVNDNQIKVDLTGIVDEPKEKR